MVLTCPARLRVRPVTGQGWCTTKVWYPPPLGSVMPAAQTSVADPGTALTPVMIGWPSGPTGVVSGVHDVPFQCRTEVVPRPGRLPRHWSGNWR